MERYIRICVRDLPRETAKAALGKARRQSDTPEVPALTSPDNEGFYYAVIKNGKQHGLFVGFLNANKVPHTDLSQPLPNQRVVERRGRRSSQTEPDTTVQDITKLVDRLAGLFKS